MSVYDDAALELADIFDQIRAGTLAPFDAAPLISAQLQTVMPDSQLQFAKVEQVLGRITGLFFVDGPPDTTLGKPGASAIDLTNHLFYGPKDAVTGWPAGVAFVGATGPAGTITGATAVALSAGAAPTVTLGGTSTARTFQFGIPAPDISNLAVTWNGAVDQVGLGIDITDTLSGAGSLAARIRKGGSLLASISKAGAGWLAAGLTLGAGLTAPSAALAGNVDLTTNAAAIRLGSSQDVVLNRDGAADALALFRGANAQAFRIYNTRTDGSNYERGGVAWAGNALVIGTEAAGTGSGRNLQFSTSSTPRWQVNAASGHLIAVADNTYDFGASAANRPRNVYVGTDITVGDQLRWTSSTRIGAPSDGVLLLRNAAGTNFSRLQFGGTTSGFAAIKLNGARLDIRLADDSAYATLGASKIVLAGDVHVERDTANILALRNGTAAQFFRIYNTYTDASNSERLAIGWNANTCYIATENSGTGTTRNMVIRAGNQLDLSGSSGSNGQWNLLSSGTFRPGADNTFDLGQIAVRVRNGFFSGYLSIGDGVTAPGATAGNAKIYVDAADGDLKVIFGDGTIKTIVTDT